jgi:hypothetical protein
MTITQIVSRIGSLGLIAFLLTGCNKDAATAPAGDKKETHAAHDDAHGHAHASLGPHGGTIIEMGTESYHAELVHDEATDAVTVYILDGSVKKAAPIGAVELTVNLKHGDAGEQLKLAASPDTGDPEGKSSRFVSDGPELGQELHEHHDSAVLVVKIDGKQYRGEIAHDHEHDTHDHADEHGHEH